MTLTLEKTRTRTDIWWEEEPTYSEFPPETAQLDDPRRGQTVSALEEEESADTAVMTEPLPSVEERVRALKERSGLTWKQLGRVFGVSMRAVQGWAVSGRLSSTNLERLARIEGLIEELQAETPAETRLRLLSVRPNGAPSPFAGLLEEVANATPQDQRSWVDRV